MMTPHRLSNGSGSGVSPPTTTTTNGEVSNNAKSVVNGVGSVRIDAAVPKKKPPGGERHKNDHKQYNSNSASSNSSSSSSSSHHPDVHNDGTKNSLTTDATSTKIMNSSINTNPAKYDDWNDIGRRTLLPAATTNEDGGNAAMSEEEEEEAAKIKMMIERNSCMLEDLLATALEYDEACSLAQQQSQPSATTTSNTNSTNSNTNSNPPSLTSTLQSQIRHYVTQISVKYHNVGFHSFEHASHVMLSATKICYMLQKQSPWKNNDERSSSSSSSSNKHQQQPPHHPVVSLTGTIYDPWLHFAIALSALLHDVDHKGLPNNELQLQKDALSVKYGSEHCMKSYAEWNSLDIGLSLLKGGSGGDGGDATSCGGDGGGEEFGELAEVLNHVGRFRHGSGGEGSVTEGDDASNDKGGEGTTKSDFYKMVTDLVLCTDIASKERRELGMKKWEKAYQCSSVCLHHLHHHHHNDHDDDDGRQANDHSNDKDDHANSLLLLQTDTTDTTSCSHCNISPHPETLAAKAISEQIMQAADVSHTMQHFNTFTKWNTHLYHEVLAAYRIKEKEAAAETTAHQEEEEASPPPPPPPAHPSTNWYESQIGFYDHYVIPLAQRLDACGAFSPKDCVFGPSAIRNKERWILEGRECTRVMVMEAEGMELLPPVPVVVGDTGSDGGCGDSSTGDGDGMPKAN